MHDVQALNRPSENRVFVIEPRLQSNQVSKVLRPVQPEAGFEFEPRKLKGKRKEKGKEEKAKLTVFSVVIKN
jgi:hypothetical protein